MATDPSLLDSVRVHIYRHFVDTGRADAHVIVLTPGTRSIWMAHPFSAVPTPYSVQCGGTSYWANCAWDALGIAAILGRDAECVCRCPDCNQRMDLSVKRGGVNRDGIVHLVVPPRRFWENVTHSRPAPGS